MHQMFLMHLKWLIPIVEKVESKATDTLEAVSEKIQGSSTYLSRDCPPSRTLTCFPVYVIL